MRADVLARNHANVGPAMPAPLISTRIAGRSAEFVVGIEDVHCHEICIGLFSGHCCLKVASSAATQLLSGPLQGNASDWLRMASDAEERVYKANIRPITCIQMRRLALKLILFSVIQCGPLAIKLRGFQYHHCLVAELTASHTN